MYMDYKDREVSESGDKYLVPQDMDYKDREVSETDDKYLVPQDMLQDEHTRFGYDIEIRIVLIGRTGNGKSATGNSILKQKDYFPSEPCSHSVSKVCKRGEILREGKRIIVVDTPGLFDTRQPSKEIRKELIKCISVSSPGPHAMLYVLSCRNRLTKEEEDTFSEMIEIYGNNLYKYIIFVFTAIDEIQRHNKTIEDFLETSPEFLKKIVRASENRYVAFNNVSTQNTVIDEQLETLLDMINKIGGSKSYYQNEMLRETELIIHEQYKKIESKKKRKKENINDETIRATIRSQIRENIMKEGSTFNRLRRFVFDNYFTLGSAERSGLEGIQYRKENTTWKCSIL